MEEYHVDGFRFDLASVMCRDNLGRPLESPPIVREIAKDPVLSKVRRSAREPRPNLSGLGFMACPI